MFGKHEPTVSFGGQQYTITELAEKYFAVVKDYHQLHDQYEELKRQNEDLRKKLDQQVAVNQPFAAAGEKTAADVTPAVDTTIYVQPEVSGAMTTKELVGRYYMLVRSSLAEYRTAIERLQQRLDDALVHDGHTGFLQIVKVKKTAGEYRQQISKSNEQLVNYVDSHPQQVRLVNDGQTWQRDDEQRGIKYWQRFVDYYRQQLEDLLKKDQQMRDQFKFAIKEAKDQAMDIRDQKPSFLSNSGRLRLGEIDGGIKDRDQWQQEMADFQRRLTGFLRGIVGEQRIRRVVGEGHNQLLTSLNLPYSYDGQHPNSNQVDCVVVNRQGIFILEVKNFRASELGINNDGTIYGKWGKHFKRYEKMNIVKQGANHRAAVELALKKDPLTEKHLRYLTKNIHVLYVSANPATKRRTAPQGKPADHFIGLDELVQEVSSAAGNLRPEVVEQVAEALTHAQQPEKAYPQYLFPERPDMVLAGAWQQLQLIRQLSNTNLDDLVKKKDPELIRALQEAGLKTCNGYLTHQPRKN
ncbi:nuclease-related domain-containing protein [uncultured Limosilactobacillus sp.]|uniref:nuclease-related domain-containing protein n=1 Tax=uncultured Limosilactobacillus sp. TaxID=2837629 RepID=UPI0025DFAB90|nr:nuclease-related domain-containing protein [uncultured Limosilactobacillus sp.]